MNTTIRNWSVAAALISLMGVGGCSDDEPGVGSLTLSFQHEVDGSAIVFDDMIYENAAGNPYEVSEIQYFLSDITLLTTGGKELVISTDPFAHYIDSDIAETWQWEVSNSIPEGTYNAIKFTFGLKGEKNIPNSFPNPPESNMEWPYPMGGDEGGYHYMKMNGFWLTPEEVRTPFNLHLGVGQEYDNDGNVTAFYQNWFEVTLPASGFQMHRNEQVQARIVMNVNEWFVNPNVFDWNTYGGKIMKNQVAMNAVKENGASVFACEISVTKP